MGQPTVGQLIALVGMLGACGGHHGTPVMVDAGSDGVDAGVCPAASAPMLAGGDPTFGSAGLVALNSGPTVLALTAIAAQSDGKLVAAGVTDEELVVLRTAPNGQLDASFGTGGILQLPLGSVLDQSTIGRAGLAITSDDKIVVARLDPVLGPVVRLTAAGALDCNFGSGGLAIDAEPFGFAMTADDEVVVAEGSTLLELTAGGIPDPSFGSAGHAQANAATLVAIAADGSIVTAGVQGLARYKANGAIDTSFGSAGFVPFAPAGGGNTVATLAIAGDGKILVGGMLPLTTPPLAQPPYAIVRTTADGGLDASFGSGSGVFVDGALAGVQPTPAFALLGSAIVVVSPPPASAEPSICLELDGGGEPIGLCQLAIPTPEGSPLVFSDGSFVVPGAAGSDLLDAGALAKDTPSGSADLTFGSAGVALASVGGAFDRGYAVALQADGSLIVAGQGAIGGGPLFRLSSTGAIDPTFVVGSVGSAVGDVAVQPAGGIVTTFATGPDIVTVRLDATGALDPSFGAGGIASLGLVGSDTQFAATGQTLAADGSIYVFGQSWSITTQIGGVGVVHLTADGVIDTSYGSGGIAIAPYGSSGIFAAVPAFASVESDGSVMVVNAGTVPATGASFAEVIRFAAGGVFAGMYQDGGVGILFFGGSTPSGFVQQPDGKLVVVMAGASGSGGDELEVIRLDEGGQRDTGFGNDGAVSFAFDAGLDYRLAGPLGQANSAGVALDSGGNLLIGIAQASADGLSEQAIIIRLLPDGVTNSVQSLGISTGPSTIHQLVFQPDGKLLVVGRAWTPTGSSDYAIARLDYTP
jgi:uncharacterized delta-60 repeat protein